MTNQIGGEFCPRGWRTGSPNSVEAYRYYQRVIKPKLESIEEDKVVKDDDPSNKSEIVEYPPEQ